MFSFWNNNNNNNNSETTTNKDNNNNIKKEMNITHTTEKTITNSPTVAQQNKSNEILKKEDQWIVGVLTTSDRVTAGTAIDQSGPEIISIIKNQLKQMMGGDACSINVMTEYKVIPDEYEHIQSMITQWTHLKFKLILTTGGTGLTPRDVTPDAIKPLLTRRTKGIELAMLKTSLDITPHAMLSRPVAGIRDQTLIITLPGSVKAIRENLAVILPAIPHAIGLINSQPKHSLPDAHRSKDYNNTTATTTSTATTTEQSEPHNHHHQHHHSCGGSGKRGSTYNMTPVDEAIEIILKQCDEIKSELESVNIIDSLGRIVGEDIESVEDFPNFRASIKDGYAVCSKDGIGHYKLLGDSVAGGKDQLTLPTTDETIKHCVRITTGARIPDGYDAVVMIEETEIVKQQEGDNNETIVSIEVEVSPNQDIRGIGSDIKKGTVILKKGEKIGSSEIGLLATLGVLQVKCWKLPTISIISTGDELVEYNKQGELGVGMIRDSNSPTLQSVIQEISNHFGGGNYNRDNLKIIGIIPDKLENLSSTLLECASKSDIIITSGGVSMGHLDLVKPLLEKIGKVHFGRVNMKPGKPLTFSTITTESNDKTTLVFSLPGNPVSTVVTFYLFVVPALRKLSGWSKDNYKLPCVEVKLTDKIRLDPERPEYHRAFIEWDFNQHCFISTSTGSQASCRLLSLKKANALLELPQRSGHLEKGSVVKAILIGPL